MRFLTLLIVGLLLLVPARAFADNRSIAVFVDGVGAAQVRAAIINGLPAGIDVVDSKRFRTALTRAGQAKPFAALDAKTMARFRRAASASGAEAVVVARVRVVGKTRTVRLQVLDVVAPATEPQTVRLDVKPAADRDSTDIALVLGPALDIYGPPKEPPPEDPVAPPPDPAVAPAPTDAVTPDPAARPVADVPAASQTKTPAQLVATSVIDVAMGGDATGRHVAFDNGIAPAPYVFKLNPTPTAHLGGTLYPLATTGTLLRDLGLSFDVARIFIGRGVSEGAQFTPGAAASSLGLRARIHPGLADGDPPVIVGIGVAYAFAFFGVVGPANAAVPDVTYRTIRPSLDARIPLGKFSILGQIGFRYVIDTNISTRLYEPHGYGLDAQLGVAWMFWRHVEARLGLAYERYAIGVSVPPESTVRAGSITDQWYSGRAALALVF